MSIPVAAMASAASAAAGGSGVLGSFLSSLASGAGGLVGNLLKDSSFSVRSPGGRLNLSYNPLEQRLLQMLMQRGPMRLSQGGQQSGQKKTPLAITPAGDFFDTLGGMGGSPSPSPPWMNPFGGMRLSAPTPFMR